MSDLHGPELRWGVLGAADFAANHMAPAIHQAQGARLAGLATGSAAKAARFTAITPDLALFDSYEALLASDAIDAVYIPLPNHLHVEWVLKAVAAGKHVLCEKPIAMTAAEFDALIAARDKAGLLVAEAYMIVHHPQWKRAREIVQSGALGDLVHVHGHFCYDNAADPGNIRNRPETGGGAIRDIGVYTYGSTRFVTGQEPHDTHATITLENGVDTYSITRANFDGFSAEFTLSMRMSPYQEMRFHGRDATLRLSAPFNAGIYDIAELELRQANGQRQIERFPRVNHYVLQVENFVSSVQNGADYPCPLEFSRGTQVMIDAALSQR